MQLISMLTPLKGLCVWWFGALSCACMVVCVFSDHELLSPGVVILLKLTHSMS